MDAKLLFFFALFAAVFVHENNAQLDIPTLSEVQANVDTAVEKLVAEAEAQTTKATAAVGLLNTDIQTFLVTKTEDAKAEAAKVMTALLAKIEADVTKQGGVLAKLQGCTEQHHAEIEPFNSTALKSITGCVTEKIQKAVDLVTAIVSSSKTIAAIVFNLKTDTATACPNPTIASTFNSIAQKLCEFKVVGIASARVVEQSVIIAASIDEASAFIASLSTLETELPACFAERAATAGLKSLPLVATIVACTIVA